MKTIWRDAEALFHQVDAAMPPMTAPDDENKHREALVALLQAMMTTYLVNEMGLRNGVRASEGVELAEKVIAGAIAGIVYNVASSYKLSVGDRRETDEESLKRWLRQVGRHTGLRFNAMQRDTGGFVAIDTPDTGGPRPHTFDFRDHMSKGSGS